MSDISSAPHLSLLTTTAPASASDAGTSAAGASVIVATTEPPSPLVHEGGGTSMDDAQSGPLSSNSDRIVGVDADTNADPTGAPAAEGATSVIISSNAPQTEVAAELSSAAAATAPKSTVVSSATISASNCIASNSSSEKSVERLWAAATERRLIDPFLFPSDERRRFVPTAAAEAIAAEMQREQCRADFATGAVATAWEAVERREAENAARLVFLTTELPALLRSGFAAVSPSSTPSAFPEAERAASPPANSSGGPSSSSSPHSPLSTVNDSVAANSAAATVFWSNDGFRLHYGLTSVLDDAPQADYEAMAAAEAIGDASASSPTAAEGGGPSAMEGHAALVRRLAAALNTDTKRDHIMKKKGRGRGTAVPIPNASMRGNSQGAAARQPSPPTTPATATSTTASAASASLRAPGNDRYAPLRRCFASLLQNRASYPKDMTLLFNAVERTQAALGQIEASMAASVLHVPLYKPLQRIALCIARDLSRPAPGAATTAAFAAENNALLAALSRAMAELYYFYECEVEEVPAEATAAKGHLGAAMWGILLSELEARKGLHERAVEYITAAVTAEEAQRGSLSAVLAQCSAEVAAFVDGMAAEAAEIAAAAKATAARVEETARRGEALYKAHKASLETQIKEMSYRASASAEAQTRILRTIRQQYKALEKEQSIHSAALCEVAASQVSLARLEATNREFKSAAADRAAAMAGALAACEAAEAMIEATREACGELAREMTLHTSRCTSAETARKCSATRVAVENLVEWRRAGGDLSELYHYIDDEVNMRRTVPAASLPQPLLTAAAAAVDAASTFAGDTGDGDGSAHSATTAAVHVGGEEGAGGSTTEVVTVLLAGSSGSRAGTPRRAVLSPTSAGAGAGAGGAASSSADTAVVSASSWQLDYLLSNARRVSAERLQFISKELAALEKQWAFVADTYAGPYEVSMPHALAVDSDEGVIANRRLLVELETARRYMRTKEAPAIAAPLAKDAPTRLLALLRDRGFAVPAGVDVMALGSPSSADGGMSGGSNAKGGGIASSSFSSAVKFTSHLSAAADEAFRKAAHGVSPVHAASYPIAGAGPPRAAAATGADDKEGTTSPTLTTSVASPKSAEEGGTSSASPVGPATVSPLSATEAAIDSSARTLRDQSLAATGRTRAAASILPAFAKFEAEMEALRNANALKNVSDYSKKSNRSLDAKEAAAKKKAKEEGAAASSGNNKCTAASDPTSSVATADASSSSTTHRMASSTPLTAKLSLPQHSAAARAAALGFGGGAEGRRPTVAAATSAKQKIGGGGGAVDEALAAAGTAALLLRSQRRASRADDGLERDLSDADGGCGATASDEEDADAPPPPPRAAASSEVFTSFADRQAALQGSSERAPIVPRPPPRRSQQ